MLTERVTQSEGSICKFREGLQASGEAELLTPELLAFVSCPLSPQSVLFCHSSLS